MPTITFDGNAKTIVVGFDSATTTVAAPALYSRWKEWVHVGNPQFIEAFGPSLGGESLGGGVTSGSFYFLRNDLGWRIVPSDVDHELRIVGDLYPQDPDLPLVQPPSSASVLSVIQRSATSFVSGGGTVDYAQIATDTSNAIIPHIWAAS